MIQKTWYVAVALAGAAIVCAPYLTDASVQYDVSVIFALSILALSMGFLWGQAGILSFGQTIFYGLGGYVYAVTALNTGMPWLALVSALLVASAMGAVLGYFIIYGRISDVYLSIITLVVTLIFERSVRSTSGPEYVVGTVRLNGQNGIPGIPPLTVPWNGEPLSFEGVFWVIGFALLASCIVLKLISVSPFGRVIVAIRENERRMELLGYDSRRFRLAIFIICAMFAGLSGVMYTIWGSFVAPEMFGLNQAAQVVIWVLVGGRNMIIGPVLGTAVVQYLSNWLGSAGLGQVNLVLGAVLVIVVMLLPKGILGGLAVLAARFYGDRSGKVKAQ